MIVNMKKTHIFIILIAFSSLGYAEQTKAREIERSKNREPKKTSITEAAPQKSPDKATQFIPIEEPKHTEENISMETSVIPEDQDISDITTIEEEPLQQKDPQKAMRLSRIPAP
jgi:hypothetical protein